MCVIPQFGSAAGGRYGLLGLWRRPSPEVITTLAARGQHETPLLVFFFGRFTAKYRRELADLAHGRDGRGRPFLLLDELLLLYLCGERDSRLRLLFECALPFTHADPYTTKPNELIPIEMFYGRKTASEAVFDRVGTNLVYGGRQLGKTALLLDVKRRYHNPAEGTVVRWIDLRNEGIGNNRPIDDIWNVIAPRCTRRR